MTKKKVWRYYCDFCKKAGCSGGHIASHERSCTANPNRVCAMHKHCDGQQKPVEELTAVLLAHRGAKEATEWAKAVEELREAADGCPACMLAAIRQSGLQYKEPVVDEDGVDYGPDIGFNFKAELRDFWSNVNDAKAQYT